MAKQVTATMELAQASQTIKWLDEERRKDKSTIAALQEQIQNQERQLAQQAAQIQQLQETVAAFQAAISRVTEFEKMISNYKTELTLRMDQREEALRKEQVEAKRLRQIEYEALTAHLHRLEKRLQVLPRYEEGLNASRVEEQRLNEAIQRMEVTVSDLRTRIEAPLKAVSHLEEQRRVDNRRIAELEQGIPELRKRIEAVATKLPLLEEMIQKQRPLIEEAIKETKKYEKPIEELRISDFQREQKMKQYLDQGEQVAQELERVRAQTQGFIEQQQLVKRSLDRLEDFKARMERRQNEMAEMQRVAEDRIQRQWEEWQIARAKELKKQAIMGRERWIQQQKYNDELEKQVEAIPPMIELHHSQLEALWETRRLDADKLFAAAKDLYEGLREAQVEDQIEILRDEK